jgi:hypothetical protein
MERLVLALGAVGMMRLDPDWRDELFAPPGGRWQDYRSPAQRALARDLALRAEAYAAQRAQQRRAARRQRKVIEAQASAAAPAVLRAPVGVFMVPGRKDRDRVREREVDDARLVRLDLRADSKMRASRAAVRIARDRPAAAGRAGSCRAPAETPAGCDRRSAVAARAARRAPAQ